MRRPPPWLAVPPALLAAVTALAAARPAAAQGASGTLTALVLDYPDGRSRTDTLLVAPGGAGRRLVGAGEAVRRAGGLAALLGRRVRVEGAVLGRGAADPIAARAIVPEGLSGGAADVPGASGAPPARGAAGGPLLQGPTGGIVGAQPTLVLLCAFPDRPPLTRPRAHFVRMYADEFPGVGAFVREASAGAASLDVRVSEWATLDRPSTHYFAASQSNAVGSGFTSQSARDQALARDCATAAQRADPSLQPSAYRGVQLQFNFHTGPSWAYLSALAIGAPYAGGVRLAVHADWAATTAGTHTHELGHTFGLPHAGVPGDPYASRYDVMSRSSPLVDGPTGLAYGTHFNGFHRARLGWTPATRRVVVGDGQTLRVVLGRHGTPGAASGDAAPLLLELPNDVSRDRAYYTVEYRRRDGGRFEGALPREGIVVHRVAGGASELVDVDGNRDANDDGSVWTPGETFVDAAAGIRVQVDSVVAAGATGAPGMALTVSRNVPLTIVADTLRRLYLGMPAIDTIRAVGGGGRATVAVERVEGAAPGVTVDAAAGVLRGTTAGAGTLRLALRATGADGSTASGAMRLEVVGQPAFRDSLRTLALDEPAADTLVLHAPERDGFPRWRSFGWTVNGLPPGVTVGGSNGSSASAPRFVVLTGRPTREGTTALTIFVTLANGVELRRTFAVTVRRASLAVAGDSLRPSAVAGWRHADTLVARGGPGGAATWALAAGTLPPGLALAADGVIAGVPTTAGAWSATLSVTVRAASGSETAARTLRWTVAPALTLAGPDSLVAAGTMGADFRDSLVARAPRGAVRWRVADGALPPGVALDSLSGRLVGVARAAGRFRATARAEVTTDAGPVALARPVVASVAKPEVEARAVLDQLLGAATLAPPLQRFLDLLGNDNGRVDVADVRAWLVDTGRLRRGATSADALATLRAAPATDAPRTAPAAPTPAPGGPP